MIPYHTEKEREYYQASLQKILKIQEKYGRQEYLKRDNELRRKDIRGPYIRANMIAKSLNIS